MPVKMAALCRDASLETLRPLCCHRTLRLQGDPCRCLHVGSLQALQVVVTLLASHVLQHSPQFTIQGVEVWTPRGSILGPDESYVVFLDTPLHVDAVTDASKLSWRK